MTPRWTMPLAMGLAASGLTLLALTPPAEAATMPGRGYASDLPQLPSPSGGDWTGSGFVIRATGLSHADREALVMEFVRQGAVPPSLRQLRPVTLRQGTRTATVWVMPDVFAVGTDEDRFRPALSAASAQRVMDAMGLMLPTEKIVRATYEQAEAKIPLRGLAAPRDTFARHVESDQAIAARIVTARAAPTAFLAGHSKDYVVGGPRRRNPNHIAIYGAWDAEGTRIQGSSGRAHDLGYRDYSHKPRGMAPVVEIDGVRRSVAEAMLDPQVSALIHDDDEGRVTDASQLRYPT